MRINGFRCDACCKEHLLETAFSPLHQTMGEILPTDWFFVGHGSQGKEPPMFCSVECLSAWASKQIAAREPKEVMPEERHRYDKDW